MQPEFDGTHAYYSSGLIRPEGDGANNFEMKVADDAKPGTYFYYCNLHGLTMSGFVRVSKTAKSLRRWRSTGIGRDEANAIAQPLLAEYRKEKAGTSIYTGNLAGSGDPSTQGIAAEINEFTPRDDQRGGRREGHVDLRRQPLDFVQRAGVHAAVPEEDNGEIVADRRA